MRKVIFLFFIIIIGFIFLGIYVGKSPKATKRLLANISSKVSTEIGNIAGINLKDSTLTLLTKTGNTLTVITNKNTLITKETKNINITDIKKGDYVKVTYRKKFGKNIASLVSLEKVYNIPPQKSKKRK
jgi:hypothetical protein